jgi:hypothetical protein
MPLTHHHPVYRQVYFKFLRGEVKVPGRDLCDMSPAAAGKDEQDPEVRALVFVLVCLPAACLCTVVWLAVGNCAATACCAPAAA